MHENAFSFKRKVHLNLILLWILIEFHFLSHLKIWNQWHEILSQEIFHSKLFFLWHLRSWIFEKIDSLKNWPNLSSHPPTFHYYYIFLLLQCVANNKRLRRHGTNDRIRSSRKFNISYRTREPVDGHFFQTFPRNRLPSGTTVTQRGVKANLRNLTDPCYCSHCFKIPENYHRHRA